MSTHAASRSTLTDLSAVEIARGVTDGDFTASEVVEAHIERIERVNAAIVAVVYPTYQNAREAARRIDADRAAGVELGPLAGVPVTIKDCYDVAGAPSTLGLPRFKNDLAQEDSPLVARLRKAGAVILGKTNVPQLMLAHEADNPLYGRTNNPWDTSRTPGGSSGGEAAIIAARGSALGLASDMGGSIRQPAHSCGLCGLKPTSGRLTSLGSRSSFRGMEAFMVQPGPMARTTADVEAAYKVLAAPGLEKVDPRVPPVPYRDAAEVRIEGMRVAMWADDGYFPSSTAVRRVTREAAAALTDAGAIVEEFEPPCVARAVELYFELLSADGGADARRLLAGDEANDQVSRLIMLARLPRRWHAALAWVLEGFGQKWMGCLVRHTGKATADEYWRMSHELRRLTADFVRRLDDFGYDAMLCPPHATPALRHGSFRDMAPASSYCILPNLMGAPAGVVPAGRVRAEEQDDRAPSRDRALAAAREVDRGSAGLPVGVQVVGRLWREDVALALMSFLESRFRAQNDFPFAPHVHGVDGP